MIEMNKTLRVTNEKKKIPEKGNLVSASER